MCFQKQLRKDFRFFLMYLYSFPLLSPAACVGVSSTSANGQPFCGCDPPYINQEAPFWNNVGFGLLKAMGGCENGISIPSLRNSENMLANYHEAASKGDGHTGLGDEALRRSMFDSILPPPQLLLTTVVSVPLPAASTTAKLSSPPWLVKSQQVH